MQTSKNRPNSSVIHRRQGCLGLCAVLVLWCAGAVPSWADAAADEDMLRQRLTVIEMRKVGTALMSWLTDQAGGEATASAPTVEQDRKTGWTVRKESSDTPIAYSLISHETLSELLVPTYIEAVPEKDPWGHPYQFVLNADLLGGQVLGMRSAGRDGRFETDDYVIGGFLNMEFDRDLVWGDGYFLRWPTAGH